MNAPAPQRPSYMVNVGECREFLRYSGARDETLWPDMLARQWGGHLHRAALSLVLEGDDDGVSRDIAPHYVEALAADPNGRVPEDDNPEIVAAHASRFLLHRLTAWAENGVLNNPNGGGQHSIWELSKAFGYQRDIE